MAVETLTAARQPSLTRPGLTQPCLARPGLAWPGGTDEDTSSSRRTAVDLHFWSFHPCFSPCAACAQGSSVHVLQAPLVKTQ